MALPMTVEESSPSNSSGKSVTSSKVSRGGSASGIVRPPHAHSASRGVHRQDEVSDHGDESFQPLRVDDRRHVVGAVPEDALDRPERPPLFVVHRAPIRSST